MCAPLIPLWLFTLTVSKEMNNSPRLLRIFIRNWTAVCNRCGWFYPAAEPNSGSYIRVAADSILRLTWAPAAWYELRLSRVPAAGTSCGWFYPTPNSSSGDWIRVTGDYILQLTRVPAAGYDLRLILSCGWLESADWTRLAADLYFNISSKFMDLFCKIHHFHGLLSTAWFHLTPIQALAAASRTLKKLEEGFSCY